MATAPTQSADGLQTKSFVQRWYVTAMAMLMLAICIAGFAPAIADPSRRNAPLTFLAAAHGIVFLAWILLFLVQSLLVATGRTGLHRRLGLISIVLLALILPLGFETTAAMVRRGFDLSGDQHVSPNPRIEPGKIFQLDAATASIFNFAGLLEFTLLAAAAICYRKRPDIHKRLMLFANIVLMGPPITHLIGHMPSMELTPPQVLIPFALLLIAGVARDYLVAKRIHPLTAILAIVLFVALPLQGAVIGPSAGWRHFAVWISK